MSDQRKHNHYFKDVQHLQYVDVYRVLSLFNVTDPCIQHATKKLLVAGGRGAGKDKSKDIQESIDSLVRWQQMRDEDGADMAKVDRKVELNKEFGKMSVGYIPPTAPPAAEPDQEYFIYHGSINESEKKDWPCKLVDISNIAGWYVYETVPHLSKEPISVLRFQAHLFQAEPAIVTIGGLERRTPKDNSIAPMPPAFQTALSRIYELLTDRLTGEAHKEARKFLEVHAPLLAKQLATPSKPGVATKPTSIPLDNHELQSNQTRVQWAEGLILQLPQGYNGRDSWLMNYGVKKESEKLRQEWCAKHNKAVFPFPAPQDSPLATTQAPAVQIDVPFDIPEKDITVEYFRDINDMRQDPVCVRILHTPSGTGSICTRHRTAEENRKHALNELKRLLVRTIGRDAFQP